MNAHWQVTAQYGSNVTTLGVFTFGDDARAFAQSARRRWTGATISVIEINVHVDELAQSPHAAR